MYVEFISDGLNMNIGEWVYRNNPISIKQRKLESGRKWSSDNHISKTRYALNNVICSLFDVHFLINMRMLTGR